MLDIGSRLKEAREQRGLTLADIANATKISMLALRAIERGDFAQLPGGIFTRSYIRAFADEVGLNPEIADEYRPEPDAAASEPFGARKVERNWTRRLVSPAISVGLLTCAALLWINMDVRPPPAAGVAPARAAREPVEVENVALTAASSIPRRTEETLRMDIRVRGLCWVSATSDEQVVIHRLMQPGERAVIDAGGSIELRIGDPGVFDYSINGEPGRPLGTPGRAVTVRITEENYQTLLIDAL